MCKRCPKKYYTVADKGVYNSCCDSIQFQYLCITCGQDAGCYLCTFDPHEKHECEL